jgi:large repetitive protein
MLTGVDGTYRFEGIAAGDYTVTASVSLPGFTYTSDSDGRTDWTVHIDLSTGSATAEADFAGAGRGSLAGTILDSATLAPIGGAIVSCRWAGLDDSFHTGDDVLMRAVAADGDFRLAGVPYGRYSCTGQDPRSGAVSNPAEAAVTSAAPSQILLPIGRPSPAPLPDTGTPAAALAFLGAGLLLAGGAGLGLGRRRPAIRGDWRPGTSTAPGRAWRRGWTRP